ncbi:MAG: DUF2460 domain-containing protein [Anaplasma sp.]
MQNEEAKFPEDISYGSVGGPVFSTTISELGSGREQRKINWLHPRGRYNAIYGVKSDRQFAKLINFFYAHRGRALPFRFKDWSDYKAAKQKIGTGDGSRTNFQLVKRYSAGEYSYTRTINRPVAGTALVYFNETPQKHGAVYEIDYKSGQLSFASPPGVDIHIFADFEFDVLVRFDTDFLSCSLDGHGSYGCSNIPLVEVKSS